MMSEHGYLWLQLWGANIWCYIEGWGSAIAHYILEHGVVEFAGGIQGEPSVEEAIDDGQYHGDNN